MTGPARFGPGALVWAGFDGPQAPGAVLDAIARGAIGGVILFAHRGNVRSREQVRAMVREMQEAARRGGLPRVPVAVDQEGGSVVRVGYRTVFPSAMAIAATGDPAYAERAASAVGAGLRADGITVNCAPVCDVNVEPRNPVIGTRSFGDDATRVAAFAAAWVRGSEAAGVAATPKHFPGHGSTAFDTHHTTVDVGTDRVTLERRELVPFRAAFAAGASGVMTAHVRYTALDPENVATLSPRILGDVLRGELGFRGLVLTDALEMSGVAQVETPERVIARAVNAGSDAVLVTGGLERQLAAAEQIATGVRPPRVLEAIGRARAFRERSGRDVSEGDGNDEQARALAAEIAAASITQVGPPPERAGRALRVVAFAPRAASPVEELRDPLGALEAALRRRFGERLVFARDGRAPAGDGPLVVCSSSAVFDPGQAAQVRALLASGGTLCALGSPYDATLVPERPALLSYGDVPASLEALAAVLAGEREATGRPPVRM